MEKKDYWQVFEALSTKLISSIWGSHSEDPDVLELMLSTLSSDLDFNFKVEDFDQQTYKYDPTDVLDDPLSVASITKRLRNIVLKKIYKLEGSDLSIQEFLVEHNVSSLDEENSEQSVDSAIVEKEEESDLDELYSRDNWFARTFLIHKEKIKSAFRSVDYQNPYIDIKKNLKKLFDDVLIIANITVSDNSVNNFYELVNANYDTKDYFKNLSPTFEKFLSLLEEWAEEEEKIVNDYGNILTCTIKEFTIIVKENPKFSEDVKALASVIKDILQDYNEKLLLRKSPRYTKEIQEIFEFYAKTLKLLGPKPTFDQIQNSNNLWNISKYMKFLADFGLLNKLTSVKAQLIFKQNASLTRFMGKDQFQDALQDISEELFETIEDLHQHLGLDKGGYRRKMRQFSIPFDRKINRNSQRFQSNPFKNNYRLMQAKHVQSSEHKKHKIVSGTPTPLRANVQRNITRMPSHGYARRKMVRSKILYSERFSSEDPIHTAPLHENKPLTFQALKQLDFQEVAGEDRIDHVPDDDQDYLFQKLYGNLSKTRDSPLEKRQKVMHRFNESYFD